MLSSQKTTKKIGQVDFPELPEELEILNQNINKLCLGKISRQKAVRIKFSVDSAFSSMFYGRKRKPGNAGNQQKAL